jgi:DNA-binding transcriptional ArsR family regulator
MTEYDETDDSGTTDRPQNDETEAEVADLRDVLDAIDAEAPPALELAERLADAIAVAPDDAYSTVTDAIDEGVLVEEGEGFGGVRLADEYREDETAETPDTCDIDARGAGSSGDNPQGETAEDPAPQSAPDREAAVEALRDVLRFYNHRVDDTIADHTEDGEHPNRPATAREYFTDGRGWDSETVDYLLLGWAPPNHADDLVAWLHDRGHSREAILATGAVGEGDSGGFYTIFDGRYVLPYYDADGEPAYAIARATAGDGGGGAGYAGHPEDYKSGKYAKLRHTDDRVPFDEPIYGLDTLEDGAHVVVAEGIADAITARELGYAVLSPVARQFKKDHYGPLVAALEAHDVRRVTVVADADSIRSDDADELEPETIGEAVGAALSPVGAGLRGALNTADALEDRTDVDVRVTVPPAPADRENDLDEFVNGPWSGDLAALLRSARPAAAFHEYDEVVDDDPAEAFDAFDAEKYEPTATSADETTAEIRDIYHALDRLDARRVAGRTIVGEWLDDRGDRRHFAPTWAPAGYDGTANFVDRDKWVDMGGRGGRGGPAVMAAIDAGLVRDTECPGAVSGATWWEAVDHLRELGFGIPELKDGADSEEYDDDPRDLLGLDVVVEPANALAAAAAVEPRDLADEADLPELEREDVDDVAIAVALREGWIDAPDEFPEDGRYTEAYYRARDRFGAPLPKYLDNSTLEERTELVFAALDRVRPEHVLDALKSEITVEDPAGEAIAKINPTWEESDSGERILAGYGAGFYCTEHSPHQPKGNHTFDALQVVALEHGLVEGEFTRPSGEAFKQAYRLLREEYGAPIPRWRATLLETVPVLPPAVRLLDDDVRLSETASETLQEAYDRTEALVRDALGVRDRAQLLTNVPGTGKTFSTVLASADRPTLYVTRRNDLKKQAEEYAAAIAANDEDHPDAEPSVAHLPILAENVLPDAAVREGVAAVREEGFDLLRDRHEELYERVAPELEDDDGDTDAEDDDAVDLDRGTCETAEGGYGDRWRVRVHIARALGLQPADLHRADEAVFGEPLPCHADDHDHGEGDSTECKLSVAWERIRDPDRPLDLLVGSPEHAYVDSATTYYERDVDGDRVETERAVVIDEFPEESYFNQYAGRYMDHATWLAEALVDVDTREDLLAADLAADTWVDRWLDGEGEEYGAAADAIDALAAAADVADATDHAEALLDTDRLDAVAGETSANLRRLRAALETVADADPDADLAEAVDTLDRAVGRLSKDADAAYADGRDAAGELYALVDDLEDALDPLTRGLDAVDTVETGLLETVRERVDALPVGGDLRALLEDAVDATAGEGPAGILEAATAALRGGRDGCRELALFANGGYAHPDAWAHLAGAIADTEHEDVREVSSETFTFDPEREGGRFKRFTRNGARILADKNHHGELVVDPPAFTDATGSTCPVVGLDATGRPELWKIAIGRDTERRDIHETDAERRRFLRDTIDLTVVQTTDSPLPYHGSPEDKNFQEDVELVREVAAEYTDGPDAFDDKGPAVMSTQKVLNALEEDLTPHAGATVEYEKMKGSDALGDHQVAVLLGSQHYSDAVPEKWGLVAGESPGRGDTQGGGLDYGTDVANAYLRYMREDHVMQGILRAGRNDDTTVVFAHTSALRADLPVDAEGALVSAHSQGTLQVVEAAAELRGGRFTAREVADAVGADGVGLRQVQNVLADLREAGYVDVREAGSRGRAYEYDSVEDPGLAEVKLPDVDPRRGKNEKTTMRSYSWDFVLDDAGRGGDTGRESPRPTIPASTAADPVAIDTGPPG